MNDFRTLVYYLQAIVGLCKDIHYTLSGSCFITNHKYVDDIEEAINPYIDEIKENYFMYNKIEVPSSYDVYTASAGLLEGFTEGEKDAYKNMGNLSTAMKVTIYMCDEMADGSKYDSGDKDLLGRLATDLKHYKALLDRIII